MAIKKVNGEDGKSVTWQFGDGGADITVSVDSFSDEIKARLLIFAIREKLGNSYADAKSAVEDGDAPTAEAYAREQVAAMADALARGVYSERVGGTGTGTRTTVLVEAYMRYRASIGEPIELKAAREKIDGLPEEAIKAATQRLKPIIAQVKLERMQARAAKAAGAATGDLGGLGL